MISLDRFAYGIADQQDAEILGWCSECGMEIYDEDEAVKGIHKECEEDDNDD